MQNRILFLMIYLAIQVACTENPKSKILEDSISSPIKTEKTASSATKTTPQPKPKKAPVKPQSTKKEIQPSIPTAKNLLLRDSQAYSFRLDKFPDKYDKMVEHYTKLACEDIPISSKLIFDKNYRERLPHSSAKTNLYDGKLFCLKDLNLSGSTIGKLLFGRTEGGHASDAISIVTANPKNKSIYHLDLSSHYGREGFDKTIFSKLDGRTVFRKIEIRYGDSNLPPDSLALQPRRVIDQAFLIDEFGVMTKIHERIKKYNING